MVWWSCCIWTAVLLLKKEQLIELLEDQFFQFDGELYEQIDGVANGSNLGPLLGNTFMFSLEEKLRKDGQILSKFLIYRFSQTLRRSFWAGLC